MTPPSQSRREFDWGGCLLTDKRPREEVEAFVGSKAQFMGQPGVIESIRLVEGEPPWTWDAEMKPRPLYRVGWRPL